jgi:hypothetical protein
MDINRRRVVEEALRILAPHMDVGDLANLTDVETAVATLQDPKDLAPRRFGCDDQAPIPGTAPISAERAYHIGRIFHALAAIIPEEIRRCEVEQNPLPATALAGDSPTN